MSVARGPGNQQEYKMPLYTGPKPDFTSQNSVTYKTNIDDAISAIADTEVSAGAPVEPIFRAKLRSSLGFDGHGTMTFSRTEDNEGKASYRDLYGRMQKVDADVPRFEAEGLLLEGNMYNYCPYSEQFDVQTSGWSRTGGSFVVTGNALTAPDGTLTATKLDDQNAASQCLITANQLVFSAGQNYTFSCFVRKDAVSKTTRYAVFSMDFSGSTTNVNSMGFDTSTGEFSTFGFQASPDQVNRVEDWNEDWWRISISATSSDGGNTIHQVTIVPANGANADLETGDITAQGFIHVWGAQTERSQYATSYYGPTTTGQEQRGADLLFLDYDWNFPISDAYTIACEVDRNFQHPFIDQYVLEVNTSIARLFFDNATDTLSFVYDTTTDTSTGWAVGTPEKLAVTIDGVDKKTYRDGVEVDTIAKAGVVAPPLSTIRLGYNGGTGNLFGHLKNLQIFDRGLTPAEVAAL